MVDSQDRFIDIRTEFQRILSRYFAVGVRQYLLVATKEGQILGSNKGSEEGNDEGCGFHDCRYADGYPFKNGTCCR